MVAIITFLFVALSAALLGAFLLVTVREMKRLGLEADGVRVPVTTQRTPGMGAPRYSAGFRRAAPAEA